jgi:hypothetical protein
MMQNKFTGLAIAASALTFLAACGDSSKENVTQQPVAAASEKQTPASSPGKPSAPISFRYEVLGTPIVGQPVSINVFVSSSVVGVPITLLYRVNDASSMLFPESQAIRAEFTMEAPGDDPRSQQITVVPQREGRLYLNVSAEIETADGTMLKSTSIPIQVGSAPPDLKTNGELVETPEGETVISMPANQSN